MATAAQQQAFAAQYGPYAQQAGSRLGVDPNIVLGQWGIETGWQTPASGNLAGISPGGKIASYSSPQAFTDSYVSTISNNFPGAVGAGSDASAFNNGLVNGKYGVYYQGNDAASKGLSTPTSADQSAYLSSLQTAQQHNLVQYSSGAAGQPSVTASSASAPPDTSFGGGTNYDPQTGTYTSGLGPSSPSYYQAYDANGNPVGATISPDSAPVANASTYQPVYPSGTPGQTTTAPSSGEIVTDPNTGYTAIPGTSTSASPSTNTLTGGALDVGYVPPAATGGPYTFGLATGVVNSINGWVSGIETAVGNWMTKTLGEAFGSAVNWLARAGLIILGFILLAFALWRLLDPSGEKTKTVVAGMAEAA